MKQRRKSLALSSLLEKNNELYNIYVMI